MFFRSISPVAAAVALAASIVVAGPATAQSAWTSPDGKLSLNLPANYRSLGGSGEINHFSVMRDGARIGNCSTSTSPDEAGEITSSEIWGIVVSQELTMPEEQARNTATKNGHVFRRFIGSKNFTVGGYAGYLFTYEVTNKTSGQAQTTISSGTLLGGLVQQIGLCTSSAGFTFTPAEIDTAAAFLTSAKYR